MENTEPFSVERDFSPQTIQYLKYRDIFLQMSDGNPSFGFRKNRNKNWFNSNGSRFEFFKYTHLIYGVIDKHQVCAYFVLWLKMTQFGGTYIQKVDTMVKRFLYIFFTYFIWNWIMVLFTLRLLSNLSEPLFSHQQYEDYNDNLFGKLWILNKTECNCGMLSVQKV